MIISKYIDGFVYLVSVKALRRFKEAMYKDPMLVMSNWSAPNLSPCNWNGIVCSPSKDHIIKM